MAHKTKKPDLTSHRNQSYDLPNEDEVAAAKLLWATDPRACIAEAADKDLAKQTEIESEADWAAFVAWKFHVYGSLPSQHPRLQKPEAE